jgi:large subunit ribosomal protein L7/L12
LEEKRTLLQEAKGTMQRHSQLILTFFTLAVLATGTARSAELAFVAGTIVQPEGVNEGDTLLDGTVVETGADGMAMVEYRWPSDEQGYACIRIVIFGYGQSHTVGGKETPGRCDTTVPTNLEKIREGEAFLSKGTRYGDAATDRWERPEKVKDSHRQWGEFKQWTMNAERSFTGDVVSVGGGRIKLRSPFSRRQVYFSTTSATFDSPVPQDSLVDKRVQVDYKRGNQAVRIRLISPVAVPHRPPVAIHSKSDAGIIKPRSGQTEVYDRGKKKQTDAWLCEVDLHQGDTGTMNFSRHGDDIKGMILITRGSQRHHISGTWKEDEITFWRALSEKSGQRFNGTVSIAERGKVQMAGRFAHKFRGVWSANCRLQAKRRIQSPPGAGDKRYNVVLTGGGKKKIELIKAFRSVTGLGLKESKEAIENAPYTVKTGVSIIEARQIEATLEKAGGSVTIEKQP